MLHKECNDLAQRKRQLGLRDTAAQLLWRITNCFDGSEDIFHQFIHIVGAAVGQFPFCQRPDSFIGIELRSMRRKVLDAKAAMLAEQLFDRLSFVREGVIEQKDERTAQVAQQLA